MSADVGTSAAARRPLFPPTPAAPTAPFLGEGPSRRVVVPRWFVLFVAIVAQVVLARVMMRVPLLGLIQVGAITAMVFYAALKRAGGLWLCLIAYIPAMEICLRQTRAPVPYQAAPYLLILISVMAIFTVFNQLTKPGRTALLYFALLIPSSIATISTTGDAARQPIAFALSGPASLALLIVLLSQVRVEAAFFRRVLWVFLVSGMGPVAVAITSINEYVASGSSLSFKEESNFVTAGGFGPVQVSSVMGLSVVVAVLVAMLEREPFTRVLAGLVGLLGATMSFLTFSRGGIAAALLAIAAIVIFNPGSKVARRRVTVTVAAVLTIGFIVVIPWLNDFTNGGFEERFSDTQTSRTELATGDVEIFKKHMAFGVGPGMSKYQRLGWDICQIRADKCYDEISSHTEFTRMLSEHGISGIVACVFLAILPIQAYQRSGPSKSITMAFLVWAIAQMFYANFRVSAVAVAFAFAFVRVDLEEGSPLGPMPTDEPAARLQPPAPTFPRVAPGQLPTRPL